MPTSVRLQKSTILKPLRLNVSYATKPHIKLRTNSATVNLGTDNSLLGNPNATSGESTPTWSNLTFMVPDTTSSSHDVGFTNSTTTSERSSSGFIFYDQFLLHRNLDGSLKSLWYAVPTEDEGVWYLRWNSTGDDTEGQVLVSLKATAPSKPVDQVQ